MKLTASVDHTILAPGFDKMERWMLSLIIGSISILCTIPDALAEINPFFIDCLCLKQLTESRECTRKVLLLVACPILRRERVPSLGKLESICHIPYKHFAVQRPTTQQLSSSHPTSFIPLLTLKGIHSRLVTLSIWKYSPISLLNSRLVSSCFDVSYTDIPPLAIPTANIDVFLG